MIISFDLYKNPVHAITQFTGIFIIKSRPKSLVHLVSCPLRWQWTHFLYNRSIEFCEIWSVCHWYSNVSDKSIEKGMGTVIFSVWYLEVEKTVWLSCPLRWNCPSISMISTSALLLFVCHILTHLKGTRIYL